MEFLPPNLTVVLLAGLFDLLLGEPPNRYHPVAWMGTLIGFIRWRAEHHASRPRQLLAWGVGLVAVGLTVSIVAGWLVHALLQELPQFVALIGEALVLKTMFSIRALADAADRVRSSLARGDLPMARSWLNQHLVSRETSQLDAHQIAAAAVESVAENTSDSIVAPLLYYCLFGLAGALAYRFINTADAMVGYRTTRYEWLGKPAARLDDLANLLPARLTALLMMIAAPLVGGNAARGWQIWLRDARLPHSPNAGHPMSAASGVLEIELEKPGYYRIGSGQHMAGVRDIPRAVRLMHSTTAVAIVLITLLTMLV